MENTSIEWAHHTFNPWEGCTKIGPGCDNCYAETRNNRFKGGNWGPGAPRRRTAESNWKKPLTWNRKAAKKGIRYRVFCASIADIFDNEVSIDWVIDLFDLIRRTPHLNWMILTKRIGRAHDVIRIAARRVDIRSRGIELYAWIKNWADGQPPSNVWLGATIVNQHEANRDIVKLLRTPAIIRFLSMEPLLGRVDFTGLWYPFDDPAIHVNMLEMLDLVIVGGEAGKNARPTHPDWVRLIRDQCVALCTSFMFKQWGEWVSVSEVSGIGAHYHFDDGETLRKVGKKNAGRMLDGQLWDQYPGEW